MQLISTGKVFLQFYGDRSCMWIWPLRIQELTKIYKMERSKFDNWLKKSH